MNFIYITHFISVPLKWDTNETLYQNNGRVRYLEDFIIYIDKSIQPTKKQKKMVVKVWEIVSLKKTRSNLLQVTIVST